MGKNYDELDTACPVRLVTAIGARLKPGDKDFFGCAGRSRLQCPRAALYESCSPYRPQWPHGRER